MNEREIFALALEQPTAAERQTFLHDVCDAEMRQRIERLIHEQAKLGSFLEHPPLESEAGVLNGIDLKMVYDSRSTYKDDGDGNNLGHPDMSQNLQDHDDEIHLGYLEPSTREDSLGRLGHYEILEVIGKGAFGTVLRAFDEKLERIVAVKVLAPEMAGTSPARRRFLREACTSAAVRNENVVAIYAVEDHPTPYLVMEYIPGRTLQQRLDEEGPLDVPETLRLGKQIADGLAAAHKQGLIHRDIKPGNILLEGGMDERVKITDFGLARTIDDASMTQSGMIAGTPMYMSPEQVHGHKPDQRVDLFSFGSVLYHMLSGRPPFRAPSTMAVLRRVAEDTPRPIQEIIPQVPAWMCELIVHLHAKDPDKRYSSAREVSELLASCAKELEAGRTPQIPDPVKTQEPHVEELMAVVADDRSQSRIHASLAKVAVAVLILLGVVGITEATGVTKFASTVIRLAFGSGSLVIETDDPGLKIAIDGEEVTITGGGVEELTLRPGEYKVAALKDGEAVKQELVSITRNGRTVVRMSLEPAMAPIGQQAMPQRLNEPAATASVPVTDADFARIVALLPTEQQVEEVRRELIRRNPGFDGKIEPIIENDAIVNLKFSTLQVKDISPVRALTRLTTLEIEGRLGASGILADLSPLRSMQLTTLNVRHNQVSDLTPLKGMPLLSLFIESTPVTDLSPLKDLPFLKTLILQNNPIRDLKGIENLKLEFLDCVGLLITDLSPLKETPLRLLNLHATTVSDLTPLQGMRLEDLNLHRTKVEDLSPLVGMPLTHLNIIATEVTDISPLLEIPLTNIDIDFRPERDEEILRSIKTLKTINGMPKADFWKEVDAE